MGERERERRPSLKRNVQNLGSYSHVNVLVMNRTQAVVWRCRNRYHSGQAV